MNAPARQPYGIPTAFAASGAITAKLTGLQRMQYDQTFRDMEDTIRREMEAERGRRGREELYGCSADIRANAHSAQAEHYARVRKARQDAALKAIEAGAEDRRAIGAALDLAWGQLEPVLQALEEEGLIASAMAKAGKTQKRVYWVTE